MKIIYIADCEMPSFRANSINVINTCDALTKLNHNVLLLIPNYQTKEISRPSIVSFYGVGERVDVKPISSRVPFGKYLFYSLRSVYFTLRTPHDLIIGRNILALFVSGLLFRKHIVDLHAKLWDRSFAWKTLSWLTFRSKYLVGISFNSNNLKSKFLAKYLSPKSRNLVVAPNGASLPSDELLLEPTYARLRIGYFGSIGPGRGMLIIEKLAAYFKEIDFYLFGDADQVFLRYENVKVMGRIDPISVAHQRAMCNILIAPYERNVIMKSGDDTAEYMSPIKLFEYMASKRAILTSELPAIQEILANDEAVFANPDIMEEWIQGVRKLADEKIRFQFATNSYNHFLAAYTWNQRAVRISSLF